MKRILCVAVALILVFSLAGCKSSGAGADGAKPDHEKLQDVPPILDASDPADTGGVAVKPGTITGVQGAIDLMMKQAFLRQYVRDGDYTVEDLQVQSFGEYNGCTVLFMHGIFAYTQALTSETVGDLQFCYCSGQKLLVYNDGTFLDLGDAYEQDWLDDGALNALHGVYKEAYSYLYDDHLVTE